MKKEKNGITLIALVVTIVVLLILASVSISMLRGENGIIKQAQDAKLETRAGDVDEIVKLWKQEHYASDYVELGTTSEEELLSKMLNDKKVFEEEIDRDNKIIIIGSKEIDYNLNHKPYDESNFVTEWKVLENGGQITLPFWGNCDMTIDWGDGTIEQYSEENTGVSFTSANGQPFHEYENAGNYLVSVYGTYDSFGTGYGSFTAGDSDKLIKVLSFGDTKFTNINFREAENLEYVAKPNDRVFSRLTSCAWMFSNCTNLQTISEGLFASCPNVTDFCYTFYNCTNLQSIPEGLFASCPKVTNFSYTFYNCTNLQSIPEGLFASCSNATDFGETFSGCSNLQSIPEGLFASCPNVTDFSYTFSRCSNLQSIPEGLFASCPNVTDFSYTFSRCINLQSIPEGLFASCPNVTDFSYTFYNCTNLKGKAPDIYTRTNVTSHRSCFYNCTNLENYDDIPNEWK